MIGLTRTSGEHCCLDPAEIQRVETCPETIVYLTDGAKYPVTESLDEIVRRIREFRAAVMTTGWQLADIGTDPHPERIGLPAGRAAPRIGSLIPLRSRPES